MALIDDGKSGEEQPPRRVLGYQGAPEPEQDLLPNRPAWWSLCFGLALAGLFVVLASMLVSMAMTGRAMGDVMQSDIGTQLAVAAVSMLWLILSLLACGLGVVGLLRARRPGVGGRAAALAGLALGAIGFTVVAARMVLSQQ